MKTAALLMYPMLAMGLDYRAVQDHGLTDWRAQSDWICGHNTRLRDVNITTAGIITYKEQSADYVRFLPDETLTPDQKATSFSDLFCYNYIRKYKNPEHEDGLAGFCVRDATKGNIWKTILATDAEVRTLWGHFGTDEGYQKSVGVFKGAPASTDPTVIWGSGNLGSVPNNWCGEYMKEMLCHIGFPQFADNRASLLNTAGPAGLGALIRPVKQDWCEDVLDICNRHEPKPYKGQILPWLNNTLESLDQDMDNDLWCKVWNSGYNISKAAPGVGAGGDGENSLYTAEWEASSSLTPLTLVCALSTLLAIFL